ncbi:hypothetical protein [Kribbella sp. CA-293567]|uniref:hypothetical protein n=1 Tax=Kribbella sp. CA-293567 TaxID=3002436 RepID=UPI0022DD739D|nr:hypothetical protein [Kribbella sp. CA-293567]WBQ02951.1 hypothetical protein OX958_23560 [Kribbella sp. CA-293567]
MTAIWFDPVVEQLDEKARRRFWSKVSPPDANGCRFWTGSLSTGGYGQFWLGPRWPVGQFYPAHRMMLLIATEGAPAPDMLACHRCPARRRDCVWHVRWGTVRENRRDRLRDGTYGWKLTPEQVCEIVAHLCERKLSRKEIAARYGVHRSRIGHIAQGRAWGILFEDRPDA